MQEVVNSVLSSRDNLVVMVSHLFTHIRQEHGQPFCGGQRHNTDTQDCRPCCLPQMTMCLSAGHRRRQVCVLSGPTSGATEAVRDYFTPH